MSTITTALIVVDMQNDFCEGGALAVPGGDAVAERIRHHLEHDNDYDLVVATKDWHIRPGAHYVEWPVHCQANTPGADFHEALIDYPFDEVVYKGQFNDGYSGFDGHSEDGKTLYEILNSIRRLVVCGLAFDYCVKATALDARRLGWSWSMGELAIRGDLTAAVNGEVLV